MGEKAHYGGQAVIEGVMMRSPRFFAVACRRANKEIIVQEESVQSVLKRFQWLNKPFLRGTLALIDALALGMKSLMFSANVAMEDLEESEPKKGRKAAPTPSQAGAETSEAAQNSKRRAATQSVNDITIGMTMILGLALGIGIFFVAPQLLVGMMKRWVERPLWLNLIVGGVKLTLFVGYITAISLMKDIRRVFEYHGAEHKVINTFESDSALTPENLSKHGTVHPRCGTSFILVVLVISIVAFCFLGWSDAWYERVFYRLLLLPVIAGIAYEVIRFAGRYRDSRVLSVLLGPGLWLQRLTTREPSDDQVEVALRALEAVIRKEEEAGSAVISNV